MTDQSKGTTGFCEDSPFLAFTAPELAIMKARMCRWYGRHPDQKRAAKRLFQALAEMNDALSVHRDREFESVMLDPNQDVSNPFTPHRKDRERSDAWHRNRLGQR
jgi:hypothetical protein